MELIRDPDGTVGVVTIGNRDTAPAGGTLGWATDGNPATTTTATEFPAYHYNMLIAEIMALLAAVGLASSDADWTQVYQSILALHTVADTGAANALAVAPGTPLPAFASILGGTLLEVIPAHTTTAAAPTIAISGGAAQTIVYPDGSTVPAGAIKQNVPIRLMKHGSAVWLLGAKAIGASSATGTNRACAAADENKLIYRANSNSPMLDTVPGTGSILPAGTYGYLNADSAAILMVSFPASGPLLDNAGSALVYLGPGQRLRFLSDGANYWALERPARCVLGANTTFNVNSSGNDANNGLTSNWLTIQHALDFLQAGVDLNGFTATVSISGNFTALAALTGPLRGQNSPGQLVLSYGNGSTHSVVNGSCLAFTNAMATVTAPGGTSTFAASGGGGGQGCVIRASSNANVVLGQNLAFNGATQFGIYVEIGAIVKVANNFAISGGGGAFIYLHMGGRLSLDGVQAALTGTPAFSSGFIILDNESHAEAVGFTFTGAGTGLRSNVIQNSSLYTAGGGAAYFPGNSAGTTASGGQTT